MAGSAAPVVMNFLDVVGSKTGALFPTGHRSEVINGLTVTLIDVAVPMIWFRASELGVSGGETKEALEELQDLAAEHGVITKRGAKRMFLKKLWERMSNYYPAP